MANIPAAARPVSRCNSSCCSSEAACAGVPSATAEGCRSAAKMAIAKVAPVLPACTARIAPDRNHVARQGSPNSAAATLLRPSGNRGHHQAAGKSARYERGASVCARAHCGGSGASRVARRKGSQMVVAIRRCGVHAPGGWPRALLAALFNSPPQRGHCYPVCSEAASRARLFQAA